MHFSRLIRRSAALPALALLALAAHADVKLVQKTTTENAPKGPGVPTPPNAPKDGTATVYIKGARTRTEVGTTVTISDAEKGSTVTIDTKAKTFYTVKLEDLAKQVNPLADLMDIKIEGDVKPGDKTREIAGKTAHNYTTSFTLTMNPKAGAGLPAGGDGPFMTMVMEGEQWTTDAISLDPKAMAQAVQSNIRNMARMLPNAKAMVEKMGVIKGLTLASSMSMTFKSAFPLPGLGDKPIVAKTEVISVSEESLPDSLFEVPKGYKEVKAPAMTIPGFGG